MTRPLVAVVAQSFKESFSAAEVAERVSRAVAAVGAAPHVVLASDGGDGLLEALADALDAVEPVQVTDPLGRRVKASVGWLDGTTAVVESRLACGLGLLTAAERDPLLTSSRGVGELVNHGVEWGAQSVLVGLGGSATMDGGVGMARAWGWVPRDASGVELPEGGGALLDLVGMDPGGSLPISLIGLCDVQNPLIGALGARVYAAQKGASARDEEHLARGLERLVDATAAFGGAELANQVGAGAAGGLGFGILCFGGGRLTSGAGWVLDRADFASILAAATLVVTGEGAFDQTSSMGKLTGEVLRRASEAGVPVLLLAPRARNVPQGVMIESGGGIWSADELERRAAKGTERTLRLMAD
jgi:glycerate kinase